jgi:hypothetical protein
MATHLLDSLSGGSEKGDGDDDRGKSRLTTEQKQSAKQTVHIIFERTKDIEAKTTEKLKDEAAKGNLKALRILEQRKNLSEVVAPKSPHSIFEHMQIVNSDIKKVFGSTGKSISKIQNSVPTVFKLYQNYPNPFNPVCVIKYDLPKDVKAVIKIYDILGREVKTLVNEFKKAGAYTVNFDGSVYASGVYFYRIEAGDFVESKKMVMVK